MNWTIVKKFPLQTDLTHITEFLRERNIQHQVYEETGMQVIAVSDPRMVEPVATFIDEVTQGKIKIEKNSTSEVKQKNTMMPSIWEQIKAAPISLILILLSAVGALIIAIDDRLGVAHLFTFQDVYGNKIVPFSQSLQRGEIWRFLTPAFLHFGLLHVLFNSLWVWDLGRRLELLLGKRAYILFFIFTAGVSNFAQYLWMPDGLFGGMSGVVYALIGFIMVSHRLAPNRLTDVPRAIIGFMLVWLVLCMTGIVDYFIGGGVANAAHVGGLIAGCLFAVLTVKRHSSQL